MAFHKQDTFNVAAAGLLAQGKRALDDGRCAFRAPDGSRCAVGMLIPDAAYEPRFDTGMGGANEALRCAVAAGHDLELCIALMQVHDKVSVREWAGGLALVAKRFDLRTEVLHGHDCVMSELTAEHLKCYFAYNVPNIKKAVEDGGDSLSFFGNSPYYSLQHSVAKLTKKEAGGTYPLPISTWSKAEKMDVLKKAYGKPMPFSLSETLPEYVPALPEFKMDLAGLDALLKLPLPKKAHVGGSSWFW